MSDWNAMKLRAEKNRDQELKRLTLDQMRAWALSEVAAAHDRESVRAHHASKLDDTLRSLFLRLHELLDDSSLTAAFRSKFSKSILAHQEMWQRATDGQPCSGAREIHKRLPRRT